MADFIYAAWRKRMLKRMLFVAAYYEHRYRALQRGPYG